MGQWAELEPGFAWRRSQAHLLELASHVKDERWHLSAPPGAGKTLIGLELARRLDRPTLVLSPTRAIRDQWCRSTSMFGAVPARFASADLEDDAPLLSLTYQLLGNPGSASGELRDAARRLWLAELELTHGPDEASSRMEATEAHDPARASRELRRHLRALRRSLGTGEDVGVPRVQLLGERATAIVEQLVARDIGCVVLDECHHLLDWWALVVTALVERLDPAVIGLTATLPDPGSSREADNYTGLLGPVDAELHLTALVAEGALAPWRDAVRLTRLADSEQAFLDEWTERFADALDDLLVIERFIGWAVQQVVDAAHDRRVATDPALATAEGWAAFWDRDPLAAVGLARWWIRRGLSLPAGFEPPGVADLAAPLTLDDRLRLLDTWLHDPEATATDEDRAAITGITRRHGVSLTTAGIRWGRSVADVVCARSTAKGEAAASIVAEELGHRGDGATVLVVVERDRAGAPPAEARAVLGDDAGTAARMLGALCADPDVVTAGVIAVTGSGAWCDAANAERISTAIDLRAGEPVVRTAGCDIPGAVALTVDGTTWTASQWLDAAEVALEARAAQVLVATRGLVGEGWDHAPVNVLVDCSEVASRAATTQLRGRALRLDPAEPDKVASLWDVAVVHPTAQGDWSRLRRRHAQWWGPDPDGVVRTGIAKLHPLADSATPPGAEACDTIDRHSSLVVASHGDTRAAWRALDPGGIATTAVSVRAVRPRRRVRTRSTRWRRWAAAAGGGSVTSVAVATAAVSAPLLWPAAVVLVSLSAALGREAVGRRRSSVETLAALGQAVVAGLAAAGIDGLEDATVVAAPDPAGGATAVIEGVDDDAAAAWSDALADSLGPLGTPRWMLAVGDEAWRVPASVGATRASAEAFADAFRSVVPGVALHQAGSPEATVHVLRAAQRRADDVTPSLRWS